MSGNIKNLSEKNLNRLYEDYSSKNKILKRTKLCDYYYLRLLEDTILNLKGFYKVKWDLRSWELFIGPFVHRYVSVIYDRIQFNNYLSKIKVNRNLRKNHSTQLIASDRDDFLNLIENNNWNIDLLALIDKSKNNKKVIFNNILKKKVNKSKLNFKILNYILYKLFKSKEKILIYKPNWSSKIEILKLYFKLKILPIKYDFSFFSTRKYKKNDLRFTDFNTKYKNLDKIEKIFRNIFFEILPEFYIEDFKSIKIEAKNLPLGNNISKVYSSLCIWEDTAIKFWLCENLKKLKLYYSQHGVNYGMTLYSYSQVFERKLSDYYLTWGWNEKKDKSIIPFFSTKSIGIRNKISNKNKKILIVNSKSFKYLPENHTAIYYGYQSKKYNEVIHNLYKSIPKNVRKNFYVKNYPYEALDNPYNLDFLKNKFEDLNFLDNKKNILSILKNYKCIIHTYLGTTFLECLSANIPSVLLIDIDRSLFNSKTKKMLKKLENFKIIHKNSNQLIKFILNSKFNDNYWWNDKELQKNIKNFCKEFVNVSNSLSEEVVKKLI